MSEYTIWRSSDSVRIEAGGAVITLSPEEAVRLGNDLRNYLTRRLRPGRVMAWTEVEDAELTKLYLEERLSTAEIGSRLGRSMAAVSSRITILNISNRNAESQARMRLVKAKVKA